MTAFPHSPHVFIVSKNLEGNTAPVFAVDSKGQEGTLLTPGQPISHEVTALGLFLPGSLSVPGHLAYREHRTGHIVGALQMCIRHLLAYGEAVLTWGV